MERKSFVFYASYLEAANILKAKERDALYRAIVEYGVSGIEPQLKGAPLACWVLIKPQMDANNSKYENGKRGGRPSKTSRFSSVDLETTGYSKKETTGYSKKETTGYSDAETKPKPNENENVDVNVDADGIGSPPSAADPRLDADLAQLMQHYQQEVGDFPRSALDDLQHWREVFPTDVLTAAMDEAAQSGHRSWKYIDGILKGWQRDGVRTLGDVNARRDAHEAKKKPAQPQREELEWFDE